MTPATFATNLLGEHVEILRWDWSWNDGQTARMVARGILRAVGPGRPGGDGFATIIVEIPGNGWVTDTIGSRVPNSVRDHAGFLFAFSWTTEIGMRLIPKEERP